jgi:hypothetical protein
VKSLRALCVNRSQVPALQRVDRRMPAFPPL